MLKAILFDSDGVLVDTERLFFEATRDAFQAEGVDFLRSNGHDGF